MEKAIVVCELHPDGHVKQYDYPDVPTIGDGPPPWGTPMEWAMRFALVTRTDLKHPVWIELRHQPASLTTIAKEHRRMLRWTPPAGGTH